MCIVPLLLHAEGTKVTAMDGESDGSTCCVFPGEVDGEGGRSESKWVRATVRVCSHSHEGGATVVRQGDGDVT